MHAEAGSDEGGMAANSLFLYIRDAISRFRVFTRAGLHARYEQRIAGGSGVD